MADSLFDSPPPIGSEFLDWGWVVASDLHESADGEIEETDKYVLLISACHTAKRWNTQQQYTSNYQYTVLIVQRLTEPADSDDELAVASVTDEWKVHYSQTFRGANAFNRALRGELEPEARWAYQQKQPRAWLAGYFDCLENAEA